MQLLGTILLACLVLTAVKAAAVALLIALALSLVVGLIARPKETFGFLLFMTIVNQPAILVALVATALACALIRRLAANSSA